MTLENQWYPIKTNNVCSMCSHTDNILSSSTHCQSFSLLFYLFVCLFVCLHLSVCAMLWPSTYGLPSSHVLSTRLVNASPYSKPASLPSTTWFSQWFCCLLNHTLYSANTLYSPPRPINYIEKLTADFLPLRSILVGTVSSIFLITVINNLSLSVALHLHCLPPCPPPTTHTLHVQYGFGRERKSHKINCQNLAGVQWTQVRSGQKYSLCREGS